MFFHRKKFIYVSDSQPGAFVVPRGHLTMPGDIFGCQNWKGATDIGWVVASATAKYPLRHQTGPKTKWGFQNVNSAEIEKPFTQYLLSIH